MTMLPMPDWTASSTPYWITGLSTSTSISFGCAFVAGRKRVPRPAAGKTALRIVPLMRSSYTIDASVMIDPAYLRDNLEAVRTALANRGMDMTRELEELAALEARRRRLVPELEGHKREQNTAADEVAKAKRRGEDTTKIQDANRQRSAQIKQLSVELDLLEQRRNHGLLVIPNIPHASVPLGKSAEENKDMRRVGTPRSFTFPPQAHWDLGPALGIIDFERGTKIAGAGFTVLVGAGARADQLHARSAHEAARLHRGRAAVHGQHRDAHRHGQPAEVRSGSVQDRGRLGPVSRADGGGPADQHAPRRNPRREAAADPLHGVHAVLPQRGGVLRRRRARPHSSASVRQGGADGVFAPRGVVRRARTAHRQRRRSAETPRAAVSRDAALHRRHGIRVGEDLRPRGVAAKPEHLSRNFVVQQHRGVPGAAREHQAPS